MSFPHQHQAAGCQGEQTFIKQEQTFPQTILAAKRRRGCGPGQEWRPGDPMGYHDSPSSLDQGMVGRGSCPLRPQGAHPGSRLPARPCSGPGPQPAPEPDPPQPQQARDTLLLQELEELLSGGLAATCRERAPEPGLVTSYLVEKLPRRLGELYGTHCLFPLRLLGAPLPTTLWWPGTGRWHPPQQLLLAKGFAHCTFSLMLSWEALGLTSLTGNWTKAPLSSTPACRTSTDGPGSS
ncbi:uncharacterized protein LOC120620512 [Pteropus medius]|uniref:uncharacterized protein LOC120620512 n=1 Tax=Pteropus vampyrus TaxID=132908 RepID=UPI00196A2D61|nr:uncharacterized protein LOC120620512 [Pteropus giganteus]